MRYYFAYGADVQFPSDGAWTAVEAQNVITAEKIFKMFHPPKESDTCLNCAMPWGDDEKAESFNKFCAEKIIVTQTIERKITKK